MATELERLRKEHHITQKKMAAYMGLPIRTYEDLEHGRSRFRPIHQHAFDMAIIRLAIQANKPSMIPAHLKALIKSAGEIIK